MERGGSRTNITDKKLTQRISQYVDTQPKQKYITTEEVIFYLQNKFPEYNRKKKKALSSLVQRFLQELLLERYGPQNKKSRKKSILVEDNSSSSPSDVEEVNTMPVMVADCGLNNTVTMETHATAGLNNTMRNIYQQSHSTPCSPLPGRRREDHVISLPSSPTLRDKPGFFIDRQPGKRSHSTTSDGAPQTLHNVPPVLQPTEYNVQTLHNVQPTIEYNVPPATEEHSTQRKDGYMGYSDGLISDEIIEEEEAQLDRQVPEVFEVIKDAVQKSVKKVPKAEEERREEKKNKLMKKTLISVEELHATPPQLRKLSTPHRGARPSSQDNIDPDVEGRSGRSNKRRESAPHYSRRYDADSDSKTTRKEKADQELLSDKPRPGVEGVSEEEEAVNSRRSSHITSAARRRSSRYTNTDREYRNLVQTSTTFADIAGVEEVLEEISRLLIHLVHPEVFSALGVSPTQGLLLHGPPGCGKTLLANAIAGEMKLPFFSVTGTELVSGFSGESEHNIRSLFRQARSRAPSILFIDELDSICGKREESQKDMEKRIVTQLLASIDDLASKPGPHVLVLGATNRPETLDSSMRRAGRLDREVCLGIPNERQRIAILTKLCAPLKLDDNFDFHTVAHNTPGYVAADLVALVREASLTAVSRSLPSLIDSTTNTLTSGDSTDSDKPGLKTSFRNILSSNTVAVPFPEEKLANISIAMEDFLGATKLVQPSAKREGFATVPNVTWADVGALDAIREELTMSILAPVKYPEKFAALGLTRSQGILIAGPPGCGKTLLAKAVANESGINFISVKGPELLNMYVGESERAVRTVFQRARASAPCVIFFDEIDSLVPKRSNSENNSAARVVNQLLTEMDGLESRKNVFIIGATNRMDIIDPAMLRPGRLDKTLFVPLPNEADRLAILLTLTRDGKPKLSEDVSFKHLAEQTEGYTGADLSAVVREGAVLCLKEAMLAGESGDNCVVCKEHLARALKSVRPSVTLTDRLLYEQMSRQYNEGL